MIGNAVKFTYRGEVALEVEFEGLTGVLTVKVRDTGVGIRKEDMNKLFNFLSKISSTKEMNRSGMGLGLTISKMIVQELGGQIEVDSRVNVGSLFTFSIPL